MEIVNEPASWRFFMNAYTASLTPFVFVALKWFCEGLYFCLSGCEYCHSSCGSATGYSSAIRSSHERRQLFEKITGELTKSEQKTW